MNISVNIVRLFQVVQCRIFTRWCIDDPSSASNQRLRVRRLTGLHHINLLLMHGTCIEVVVDSNGVQHAVCRLDAINRHVALRIRHGVSVPAPILLVIIDGEDMLVVGALGPPLKIAILLLHDWLVKIFLVIEFYLTAELTRNYLIILNNFKPFELSNEEALTLGNRPVLEYGSHVKSSTIRSNCICLGKIVLKS
jgi:hypothetical protein